MADTAGAVKQQQLAFDLFTEDRLPRKPYCTDDLASGLLVRPLHIALAKRYIQPNRPGMAGYLAFDVDRADAGSAWMDSNAPRPNFVIKNPDNGHAHYLYALEHAVCTTSAARLQPLRYLSAIERAIATELGADPGYSGLIIKNPSHRHWQTIITETTPYTLSGLASRLDLTTKAANSEIERESSGLGRNCTVFDELRVWAYKAVTDYWRPGGETAWMKAVRDRAHGFNLFAAPLQMKEVEQIAKSVGKWVWKRFSPVQRQALIERTHTPEIQAKRGQLKGAKLREAMLPRVIEMNAAGHSQSAIARETGISQQTIGNWLKRALLAV
jgi:hypothetical protein